MTRLCWRCNGVGVVDHETCVICDGYKDLEITSAKRRERFTKETGIEI